MDTSLRVSLIQTSLYWENSGTNRAMLEEKIWSLEGKTDLIVLPEMFSTGFTMSTHSVFETMNLHTHKWMRQMASQTGAAITGSIIIKENHKFYNRLLWIEPNGREYTYDKKHLFRMANEHLHFTGGDKVLTVLFKGRKFRLIICYDLRFPEWIRNHYNPKTGLDYDVLIVVANWPKARAQAWDTLLKARAIENHCYSIGVNRTGTDGNSVDYMGHSAIYSPKGETLAFAGTDEKILHFTLDFSALDVYRDKFPSFLDGE